ncbi:MAG: glycosyltransferase family 4 protein [Chloroflexi bacterium]|nr:glycosyltransferase family 4 protein [Chloroflexota bacterium]
MKLGVVVDGPWGFIRELLADWQTRYQVQVFAFQEWNLPFAKGRVNQWRRARALTRFLADNDVVFFEWAGPLLVLASRLNTRARIITRLHSYELIDFAPRINWNVVARVILVSQAMHRRFCELYPAMAEKTTVVYNGVALDKFSKSERADAQVIGMLCNLVPIKRVYEMILTLYELKRAGAPLALRIAGSADQGAEPERYYLAMQRAVRQLELESQVTFVGPVSDPASFLQSIDIFISNSYWEGQQVALLEALATGCYCLAHFWDGADEVLPAEQLFITDRDLREKIVAFCALPSAEKIQQRGKMRARACEKFDIEQTKHQLAIALEKARLAQL